MNRLPNGRYQVRWRDTSGRQRAKNFRSKEAALHFRRKLILAEEAPELAEELEPKAPPVTFEQFAERWHRDYCRIEKAESQWIDDLSIIRNHLLPAFKDSPLESLTKHDLTQLRGRLKIERQLTHKTLNNISGLARKMLETAVDWELIKANPFSGIKPLKVPEQAFGYWTPSERDRFLDYVKSEDRALWEITAFTCHTGLRLGEVQGLHRDCLDFERRMIVVRRSYSIKVGRLLEHTKGKTIREVPMNELVWAILQDRRLLGPQDPVFQLNLRHTVRRIARLAPAAKVKAIRFHDLRHTFGSCLAMAGVPMQMIQQVMGHANVHETQRYAHLHPSYLEGVTDVLVSAPGGESNREERVTKQNIWGKWRERRDLNPPKTARE